MEASDLQFLNDERPIDFTVEGISTIFSEEQLKNVVLPMVVIPGGSTMDESEEQPSNAPFPIDVTVPGISIEPNEVQYLKV